MNINVEKYLKHLIKPFAVVHLLLNLVHVSRLLLCLRLRLKFAYSVTSAHRSSHYENPCNTRSSLKEGCFML